MTKKYVGHEVNRNFSKCWNRSQQQKRGFEFLPTGCNQIQFTLCFMWIYPWMTNQSELPRDFPLAFLAQDKILITLKRAGAVSKDCDFTISIGTKPPKSLLKMHKNHHSLSIITSKKTKDKFRKYSRTICQQCEQKYSNATLLENLAEFFNADQHHDAS